MQVYPQTKLGVFSSHSETLRRIEDLKKSRPDIEKVKGPASNFQKETFSVIMAKYGPGDSLADHLSAQIYRYVTERYTARNGYLLSGQVIWLGMKSTIGLLRRHGCWSTYYK